MNMKGEVEKMLQKDVTQRFLAFSEAEIEGLFGKEYMKTVKFGSQNNVSHQYELFEHILRTVDNVQAVSKNHISDEEIMMVKLAALFHDIGKPNVAAINEKTGQTQYIGHAKESATLAEAILVSLGYSSQEIAEVEFLIKSHDDFIPVTNVSDVTPEKISKILLSATKKATFVPTVSHFKKLLVLCMADITAQSDTVMKDGKVVDTKEARLERLQAIFDILDEAICFKQEAEIQKLQRRVAEIETGPSEVIKNGKVVNQKQIDIWKGMSEEEKAAKISEAKGTIEALRDEIKILLESKKEENIMNKKIFEKGNIVSATKLPVVTIGIGKVSDLKELDGVFWKDDDCNVIIATKENPAGCLYDQQRNVVVRVIGDCVKMNGLYDIYAPAPNKIEKLLSNPIELDKQLTKQQLEELDEVLSVASDVKPSLAPAEPGRKVIVITPEVLDGKEFIKCMCSWGEETELYEGDIFLVEDAENFQGYRIGKEEFEGTHKFD